jgi:hypothetical protein
MSHIEKVAAIWIFEEPAISALRRDSMSLSLPFCVSGASPTRHKTFTEIRE